MINFPYQTPFQYLKKQISSIDDKIKYAIPILLDNVSVSLGLWSGYNVLAHHQRLTFQKNMLKLNLC